MILPQYGVLEYVFGHVYIGMFALLMSENAFGFCVCSLMKAVMRTVHTVYALRCN